MKEHELNEKNDEVTTSSEKSRRSPVLPVAYVCLAIAVIAIIVLCIYLAIKTNDLENENKSLKANVTSEEQTEEQNEEPETIPLTFENISFDPCGFMDDNYVFDKTPNHFITGLKKGIDYSVSDSYGSSGLRTYIIYPNHAYMGVEADKTSIGFVAKNEQSSIDSVIYFFEIDRNNAERILNTIHGSVSKTCGDYASCTGNYVSAVKNPASILGGNSSLIGSSSNNNNESKEEKEREDKNIKFSQLLNLITDRINRGIGIFRVTWDTKGYKITLTVNTDTNNSTFEGSVCISTIK